MALSDLGATGVKANLAHVSAKTPIEKNYVSDVWSFRVLIDSTWFILEYTSLITATAVYNSLDALDYPYMAVEIGTDVSDWTSNIVLRSTETDVQKALARLSSYIENDILTSIAAAAAGIIGGVDTWKDDGVASTYLYEADGVTPATPPVWADDGTGAWKNGCYVVRNDNSGVPALASKGQLYGTTDIGVSFYWIVTWPYAADDILTNVSDWAGNEILTSADDDVQKALTRLNTFLVNAGRWEKIEFKIDGNSTVITNGQKFPWITVPYNATIYGWAIRASVADTFTADIEYHASLSGTPASICGAGIKPNISAATSGSGTTMAGWTPAVSKNGQITCSISGGPTAATWATVTLFLYKNV